jgi:hypothetical protein
VVGCQIQDRPWTPVGEQETDPFQMQGGTNPLDFLFQFTIVKGNVTVGQGGVSGALPGEPGNAVEYRLHELNRLADGR